MKICLRAWVDKPQTDKADELKVIWEKRDIIPEIFEQYPEDKVVVLECFEQDLTDKDWTDLKMYYGLSRGRFKVCCTDWRVFKGSGIPFYVGYPITDMFTAYGLIKAGVTDICISGELLFKIEKVSERLREENKLISLRLVPNVAYTDGLPHEDGVLGSFVRPEDLELFEDYIDVVEFEDVREKKREQALYRIYFDEKQWLGKLSDLITNLDYPGDNSIIPLHFGEKRLSCGQSCLYKKNCRLCYYSLDFANMEMYEKITRQKEEREES